MQKRQARALCLISGGLDSILAARLMIEQGVDAIGVTFTSVFTRHGPLDSVLPGVRAAQRFGIPSIVSDVSEELWEYVRAPKHGHGSNLNPCIDCRIMILQKADRLRERTGADFVVTGEVVGQRPMSQRRQAIEQIEAQSGLAGRILRPLCAKLLPPTLAEEEGLVDRGRLLGFKGRGRRPQMALAEKFGITEYLSPAGGCHLTDPGFSARLGELMGAEPDCSLRDIKLLKMGRHFRLGPHVKAIVARDAEECRLARLLARPGEVLLDLVDVLGPTTLVVGRGIERSHCETAAALTAHYSRHSRDRASARVSVARVGGEREVMSVKPASEGEAGGWGI